MSNHTDLTVFTNKKGENLLDRFKVTLKDTQLFDVLVGYFRSTGFYQLYESIESIDKTRILVGLGIDENARNMVSIHQRQNQFDFDSHSNAKKVFQSNLVKELEASPEVDENLEIGLRKFIEFLQMECSDSELDKSRNGNGRKLEIRAYPTKNIHAKVYIGRFKPEDRDYGFVITGSSNFSYSGLIGNREFNVELRQRRDVEYALDQFEELWNESVDISDDFVNTVEKKSWLNDTITPYELYLKLIYEYMQEDINLSDEIETFLPEGFMDLQYQKQAVIQALKKLEEYNGVFIADVVGLGKTFITAQLLQQVRGRVLVICPPVLKEYWESSLHDFSVAAMVESLGKLDHIIRFGIDRFDYVVIDEAHRFRNENTQSYADLLDICRGKKVILVTATPINNTIDDIFAQLKLFQAPRNSLIPGIPNLELYFKELKKTFKNLDKKDPEYRHAIMKASTEIRERILKHVMVRRTRSDITTYFKSDIESKGLSFSNVEDPRKITYSFEGPIEIVFNSTIEMLQSFKYARYTPLLYYVGAKKLTEFERQQQRNVGGFMKGILIKRLESSFYAFRKTLCRFIESYERFIEMSERGTIYISRKADVYDLLDNDDIDLLEKLVAEESAQKYQSEDFTGKFFDDLYHDLNILKELLIIWSSFEGDPKIETFLEKLAGDIDLKKKKLILFTESKETGDYLFQCLNKEYPGKVFFFSSHGGLFGSTPQKFSSTLARDVIKANFDPNAKDQVDSIRILISTDILAEGINLHRSNTIINYDLPWNPTRVLQRVGRVNRLGSSHSKIYIYNFFPTTQADKHLGLETNIMNKIQMFHHILGEDAKYLSDGEEIGSQELFDTLNKKRTYTGEDEEGDSELKYLDMIRKLRDNNPELFSKIKMLPKKARSGSKNDESDKNQLVTFFRLGKLKKFYLNSGGNAEEITFFDAVRLVECLPETQRQPIPRDYFHQLETNKMKFKLDNLQQSEQVQGNGRGRSNISYVETRLKDNAFKLCGKFTDSDEEFIAKVWSMIKDGTIAKKVAKDLKNELEKSLDPLDVLRSLRKHIRVMDYSGGRSTLTKQHNREIILSIYQSASKLPE